jgi:hypothetical protein
MVAHWSNDLVSLLREKRIGPEAGAHEVHDGDPPVDDGEIAMLLVQLPAIFGHHSQAPGISVRNRISSAKQPVIDEKSSLAREEINRSASEAPAMVTATTVSTRRSPARASDSVHPLGCFRN